MASADNKAYVKRVTAGLMAPPTARVARPCRSLGRKRLRFLVLIGILWLPCLAAADNTAPIADAGADQSIYLGDQAYLHGSATDPDGDPIVSWEWSLALQPAGSTATLVRTNTPDPYFDPDVVGDYIVTLLVSDGTTQSAPDAVLIHVSENLPPTAVVLADVTSGPAPLTVHFDGTQSSDPEGRALHFRWTFGDGATGSTDPAPTHEYPFAGIYIAAIQVFDDIGQWDAFIILIEVTVPNAAPVASPTATPDDGSSPLVVQFAANASDANSDPMTFAWDFGDPASADNTSTEANPQHIYTVSGIYDVTLNVSDGEADTVTHVTVLVDVPLAITVQFKAIVDRVDDFNGVLGGQVQVGDTIEGSYTFDRTQPNGRPRSDFASYYYDNVPGEFAWTTQLGTLTWTAIEEDPVNFSSEIDVINNDFGSIPRDSYRVFTREVAGPVPCGGGFTAMDIELITFDNLDTITSIDLPIVPPGLAQFESTNWITISGQCFETGNYLIRGHLTELCLPLPPPVIDDTASVAGDATLCGGISVGGGSIINSEVSIGDETTVGDDVIVNQGVDAGDNVIIDDGAIINQDVVIGNASHIGTNVVIGKNCVIGEGVTIGDNTTMGQRCMIGDGATIGANVRIDRDVTVLPSAVIPDGTVIGKGLTVPPLP